MVVGLHREDDGTGTLIRENGVVIEEPAEMLDDQDDEVVVAFCGSVMEKYHQFRSRCQKILDELTSQPLHIKEAPSKYSNGCANGVNGHRPTTPRLHKVVEQRRVVLEENGDGGILGAGILAAVVDKHALSSSVAEFAAVKS